MKTTNGIRHASGNESLGRYERDNDPLLMRGEIYEVPEGFFPEEIKRLQAMARGQQIAMKAARRGNLRRWIVSAGAAAAVVAIFLMTFTLLNTSRDITVPTTSVPAGEQIANNDKIKQTKHATTEAGATPTAPVATPAAESEYELYDTDVFLWLY